jgi:succinyl-CoA synthetase beta subunit
MEIEEVAKTDPGSIIVLPIEVDTGLTDDIANKVVDNL